MPRTDRPPDFTRQTATLLRWLVWGAIFVMLAVMIYEAVPDKKAVGLFPEGAAQAPLPEAERPRLPIDREKLEVIEDNTRFRSAEKDIWFHLLDVLRQTPAETLRRASQGPVTWIQLFNQPDVYRGEPITLVGHARRATRLEKPENELGFERYYQLWLQPQDNPDRVIVVYCLELPEGFPLGLTIDEPVVVTGLFFKRWLYQGQEDLELTPVVLARSLDWMPRPKTPAVAEAPMSTETVVTIVLVALFISIILIFFWHLRTRRPKINHLPETISIPETTMEEVEPFDPSEDVDKDNHAEEDEVMGKGDEDEGEGEE